MKTIFISSVILLLVLSAGAQNKVSGCYIRTAGGANELAWENDSLKFDFLPLSYSWRVTIENKADVTAKCLWDEALFIVDKKSSPIVFETTLKLDLDKSKGETLIAPGTLIRKDILPRENVSDGTISIVFNKGAVKKADIPIKLILPVEIGGVKRDYVFDFIVSKI